MSHAGWTRARMKILSFLGVMAVRVLDMRPQHHDAYCPLLALPLPPLVLQWSSGRRLRCCDGAQRWRRTLSSRCMKSHARLPGEVGVAIAPVLLPHAHCSGCAGLQCLANLPNVETSCVAPAAGDQ